MTPEELKKRYGDKVVVIDSDNPEDYADQILKVYEKVLSEPKKETTWLNGLTKPYQIIFCILFAVFFFFLLAICGLFGLDAWGEVEENGPKTAIIDCPIVEPNQN